MARPVVTAEELAERIRARGVVVQHVSDLGGGMFAVFLEQNTGGVQVACQVCREVGDVVQAAPAVLRVMVR